MSSFKNFDIISTSLFDKEVKRLNKSFHSLPSDLAALKQVLLENPITGIPLGRDCYKIRIAIQSKGKGKSGGARVITCVKIVKQRVYLLSIFDKSEKENLTDKELNLLLKSAGL